MALGKNAVAGLLFGLMVLPIQGAQPLSPVSLMHRPASIEAMTPDGSPALSLTIPAETEFGVELLSGVQTQVSHLDDPVVARLTAPVYVKGRVALPPGTIFDGRITHIRAAGRYGHPAQLSFRFETALLPNGRLQPISAVLSSLADSKQVGARVNSEGQLVPLKPSLWKRLTGGYVGAGGFALAKLAFSSSIGVAAGLPAGGAALLAYEFFWRRGREINVPPNTLCRIRLTDPVTLPPGVG